VTHHKFKHPRATPVDPKDARALKERSAKMQRDLVAASLLRCPPGRGESRKGRG
jgi:hypothetical protein